MASTATPDQALTAGADAVDRLASRTELSQASIMNTVRVIGGGMIGITVLVIVLNEMFTLEAIANDTGPFSDVIDSVTSTGGAALGLLVIGFLVLGANRIMGFFGGGGF